MTMLKKLLLLTPLVALALAFTGQADVARAQFSGGSDASSVLIATDPMAGDSVNREGLSSVIKRITTARGLTGVILLFALSFVGILSLIIIVYAGFRYITAFGGDTAESKKMIAGVVIGIVIIMGAWAIVTTVISLGGASFLPF